MSIRIKNIENDFEGDLEVTGNYLIVDSEDKTSKYDISSFYSTIKAGFDSQIESLKSQIEDMEGKMAQIDIPSQIIDLEDTLYYNQASYSYGSLTDAYFDSTEYIGRYRIGYNDKDPSGSQSSGKITLKFQHETVVGLHISYTMALVTADEANRYYFNIVEKNENGVDTSEHIIDTVMPTDKTPHTYTRWIKVYGGSQIFIDLYDTAVTTASTAKVTSVFKVFDVVAFMYSNTEIGGWRTLTTDRMTTQYLTLASNTISVDHDCNMMFNGLVGTNNDDQRYAQYSYNRYQVDGYYRYKPGTNTKISSHKITVIPKWQYAHNPQIDTCSYTTYFKLQPPKSDSLKNPKLSCLVKNYQFYMLPQDAPDLTAIKPASTTSGEEYRWNTYSDFFSNNQENIIQYNENMMNTIKDSNQKAVCVVEVKDDGSVVPVTEETAVLKSSIYKDLPVFCAKANTNYLILYGYRASYGKNVNSLYINLSSETD